MCGSPTARTYKHETAILSLQGPHLNSFPDDGMVVFTAPSTEGTIQEMIEND